MKCSLSSRGAKRRGIYFSEYKTDLNTHIAERLEKNLKSYEIT